MAGIINGITLIGGVAFLIVVLLNLQQDKRDKNIGLVWLTGFILLFGIIAGIIDLRTENQDWNSIFMQTGAIPLESSNIPVVPQPQNNQVSLDTSQKPISTFIVKSREKNSLKEDAVNGSFLIFNPSISPTSVSSTPIRSISLTSGSGSLANPSFSTNSDYILAYDGNGKWYDENWGISRFNNANYGANGIYNYITPDIALIGNFTLPINLTSGNSAVNGGASSEVNVSSVPVTGTNFIGIGNVRYNTTGGDGSFFLDFIISNSIANSEIRDSVICFENDPSNPMGGSEVTGINLGVISGQSFPNNPQLSGLNTFITANACTQIGTLASGFSSTYRMTFTVSNSLWSTSTGRFNIWFDDLGYFKQKDVRNNFGTRGQFIIISQMA